MTGILRQPRGDVGAVVAALEPDAPHALVRLLPRLGQGPAQSGYGQDAPAVGHSLLGPFAGAEARPGVFALRKLTGVTVPPPFSLGACALAIPLR